MSASESPPAERSDASGGSPASVADRLREATRDLHVRAERSGIIHDLLRGRASRRGYALLLRNLLPAYAAMEEGLERHRDREGVALLARPAVYRAPRLEADLVALCGPSWRGSLPILPSGERYAHRVAAAAEGDAAGLLGHAYVRYLGDLNGGRVMERRLAETLGLEASALSFYAYPDLADLGSFRSEYRRSLDRAARLADTETVVAEALEGFRLNIVISEEVHRAAADGGG